MSHIRYTGSTSARRPHRCCPPRDSSRVIQNSENPIDRDKVKKYNPFRPGKRVVQKRKGYTLNLDGKQGYTRGSDGVLAFDMNGDGKYSQKDVRRTNNLMKAAVGNYDFNGDGRVSGKETKRGRKLTRRYQSIDQDGDGKLSTRELSSGGAKVWMDRSGGGGVQKNELHSVWDVPGQGGSGPTRLDSVDPFSGTSRLRSQRPDSHHHHRPHTHHHQRPTHHHHHHCPRERQAFREMSQLVLRFLTGG